ncbi:MAG: type II toxin-antitoxin system RelE/ParE family toxin [Planctomyces sp.]|nr:type II toxin-antitoxin system RelE/ParE family toxin [Planctomyces sp.]
MTSPNVEIHPAAVHEATQAREWYSDKDNSLGVAFADELDRAVDRIANAPERWPLYLQNTRCFVLQRFPYLVVYRESATGVQILAVAHVRRRPGYWKSRT